MPKDVRADLGKPVGPWFKKLAPEMKAIADEVHRLILSAESRLRAELKWGMPCYSLKGMVCALIGGKTHVTLVFHRGKFLPDPAKLLAGSGKSVRSLRVRSIRDLPAAAVRRFVKGAVAIDQRS